MLSRCIPILLIPAVLGCPLFCAGGAGGAFANCCAVKETLRQMEQEHPAPCCAAHCTDQPEQTSSDPPTRPAGEEPENHTCQCICGGAILADGVEADGPWDVPLACSTVVCDTPTLNLPRLDEATATQLFLLIGDRTALSGRQLRNLHMSLLC